MPRQLLFVAAVIASLALAAPARAAAPLPPTIVFTSVKVVEGNAGMVAFEASVSLATYGFPGPGGPYQVDITAVPGSATNEDYAFAPVRVTVSLGAAPQVVKGFVVGDTTFEGDEVFTLHATAAPGTGTYLGSQDGTVTIVDDDGAAAARLQIDAIAVPEGNAGWHWIDVPVRLSSPVANVVSFDYETFGGQPAYQTGGRTLGDYTPALATMKLAPGETLAKVPVQIYGDTAWERDTSFQVRLRNVKGALFDDTSFGKVTLTNDDPATVVSLDDVAVDEGNAGTTQATLHFRFDPPAPGEAKVALTIVGGSAWAGEDYVSPGFETIYPPPGATELTYAIQVRGDTWPECDEGVTLQYQGVYLGDEEIRQAHLTILDDDGGPSSGVTCPDPFVHTETGSPIGRPRTATPLPDAGTSPDATTPPDAAGTPMGHPTNVEPPPVDGLPDRAGCACNAAPRTPALSALLLAAFFLLARRRPAPRA